MKRIIVILLLALGGCSDPHTRLESTEVIDGEVSAVQRGVRVTYNSTLPRIWVQSAKETIKVTLPMSYNDRWKVGDSVLLIIQTYTEVK
jgi:hypothetical protein